MVVPDGFHATRVRGRAGRRAADLVHASTPAAGCGSPRHSTTAPGRRPARTASSSSKTPTATAGPTSARVFYEGFNYITGIEVGFGGVWVMSPPNLYFIPDRDGDDKPDGPPEVVFDGFGYKESRHNLANGFTWGPDGWLYGGHGRTSPSDVGQPGTPADKRIHCDGGVYRIHPTRRVFENFADGTTNPWGVDFDDLRPVLRLQLRQPAPVPHDPGRPLRTVAEPAVEPLRLRAPADHRRSPALPRRRPAAGCCGKTRDAGAGRRPRPLRHAGLPRRLASRRSTATPSSCATSTAAASTTTSCSRKGSGYVASHGKDFMISGRPVVHGRDAAHRPGRQRLRVRLVRHRRVPHLQARHDDAAASTRSATATPKAAKPVDLTKLTDEELVELQLHRNDWHVRHARRMLQERATRPNWDLTPAPRGLDEMLESSATSSAGCGRYGRCTSPSRLDAGRLLRLLDDDSASTCGPGPFGSCANATTPERRHWRSSRSWRRHDPSPVVRLVPGRRPCNVCRWNGAGPSPRD